MKKQLLINGKVVMTLDFTASDVTVSSGEGEFEPIANYIETTLKSNMDFDGVYARCNYEFVTAENPKFDFAIYKHLDAVFKNLVQDFDEFTEEDEIVRIGDWGYVSAELYEEVCMTEEIAQRYLWVSNVAHKFESEEEAIDECNKFKVDELDFDDNENYVVFYTTGEGE